jgi:hypothetical protein
MTSEDIENTIAIRPFATIRSCPADFNTYCASSSPNAGCITPNGFTIRCSRGVIGTNMPDEVQSLNKTSLSSCLDSCKSTAGCVATGYMQDTDSDQGLCSLKDTVYAGIVDEKFIGKRFLNVAFICARSTDSCTGAYLNDEEDVQFAAAS